jgi:hypothetical protein
MLYRDQSGEPPKQMRGHQYCRSTSKNALFCSLVVIFSNGFKGVVADG